MTKLLGPLQVKVEEWKKTTGALEREHDKGIYSETNWDPLNEDHLQYLSIPLHTQPPEMYTRQREWDFILAGLLIGVPGATAISELAY
jgi:hypothetical protein